MNIKGAMIAASVAGMFAMGASGVASAKKGGEEISCSGINSCKGTELVPRRRQRLRWQERVQGAGDHQDLEGRLRGQGREGRSAEQVAGRMKWKRRRRGMDPGAVFL